MGKDMVTGLLCGFIWCSWTYGAAGCCSCCNTTREDKMPRRLIRPRGVALPGQRKYSYSGHFQARDSTNNMSLNTHIRYRRTEFCPHAMRGPPKPHWTHVWAVSVNQRVWLVWTNHSQLCKSRTIPNGKFLCKRETYSARACAAICSLCSNYVSVSTGFQSSMSNTTDRDREFDIFRGGNSESRVVPQAHHHHHGHWAFLWRQLWLRQSKKKLWPVLLRWHSAELQAGCMIAWRLHGGIPKSFITVRPLFPPALRPPLHGSR